MTKKLSFFLATIFMLTAVIQPAKSQGIPVIDTANLQQNLVAGVELIAQTAKQIEEHRTQLKQLEYQLRNTKNPTIQIWVDIQNRISEIKRLTSTMRSITAWSGNLQNHLDQFQDINFYLNKNCGDSLCSEAEWAQHEATRKAASAVQRESINALFRLLEQQETAMQQDAEKLNEIQWESKSAQGRMEAIQYGNQLAGNMASQIVQLRAVTTAQAAATAALQQDQANRQAIRDAESIRLRDFTFKKNPPKKWD